MGVEEEEEEVFITSGNWRGKHNSLSRGAGGVGLESHRRHLQGFSLACLLLQVKIYHRFAD